MEHVHKFEDIIFGYVNTLVDRVNELHNRLKEVEEKKAQTLMRDRMGTDPAAMQETAMSISEHNHALTVRNKELEIENQKLHRKLEHLLAPINDAVGYRSHVK